jgi:hypothetical protein
MDDFANLGPSFSCLNLVDPAGMPIPFFLFPDLRRHFLPELDGIPRID